MSYFFSLSKTEFGFEKAFFQKVHLEKGGRLIIRVILYSVSIMRLFSKLSFWKSFLALCKAHC